MGTFVPVGTPVRTKCPVGSERAVAMGSPERGAPQFSHCTPWANGVSGAFGMNTWTS
jgi:hypothetical protein